MLAPIAPDDATLDHPALATDLEFGALLREPELARHHLDRERRRVQRALAGGGWGFRNEAGLTLVRALPWDGEHFGFPCADLERVYLEPPLGRPLDDSATELLEETVAEARRRGVTLLSGRVQAGRALVVQKLCRLGLDLIDTSVELSTRLPLAPASVTHPGGQDTNPTEAVARDPVAGDSPILGEIAAGFVENRFHRDPRIPRAAATGVYTRWVAAAAEGRHGKLLVAELEGQAAGIATYVAPDDALQVGLVALVAIHPRFRGRRLLDTLIRGCAERLGGRALVTSTQVSNSAALRAFGRHGLLPIGARHIFHGWL
jgi:hypothetical protein